MANAEAGRRGRAGATAAVQEGHRQQSLSVLMIGALGVVYGDIGTSPIYAFREALHASAGGGTVSRLDVLGVLSLIVWALTVIVTVKYVVFVLRADNRGEGGTLSLMALARSAYPRAAGVILTIGICGAALFFGDAIITPAISVLSAVEGLEVVTPAFDPYVVPITLIILAVLFAVQRFGTGSVATVFGPVTLVWFIAIGLAGVSHIADDPTVFFAVNPYYAAAYLFAQPNVAFVTIGAVFLAVTGAEALYVDLGHFGRKPIVTAWLAVVFPCLLLNYFGQGAFVLAHGGTLGHPFFEMRPLVAGADGGARHGGHRHRQPGGHLRRLFADPPGGAADHPAALRDPAHVGDAVGPDLHAAGQLPARARRHAAGRRLRRIRASSPRPTASRSPATCWSRRSCCSSSCVGVWKWTLLAVARADVAVRASSTSASSSPMQSRLLEGGWVSITVAAMIVPGHAHLGARHAAICSRRPARTRSRSNSSPSSSRRSRRSWCRARPCS